MQLIQQAGGSLAIPSKLTLPLLVGDCIQVSIASQGSIPSAVTDTAGNTYVLANSQAASGALAGYFVSIWVCYSSVFRWNTSASPNTFIVTGPTTGDCIASVFRNTPGSTWVTTLQGTATSNVVTTTLVTTGNITTTIPNVLLFAFGFNSTGSNGSPGPGYTALLHGTSLAGFPEYQIVTSTGTYNASVTSGRTTSLLLLIAIAETPINVPNPPPQGKIVLGNGGASIIGTSGGLNSTTIQNLFDANAWTGWQNPDTTGVDWAGVDCGVATICTGLRFSPAPGYEDCILYSQVQGSNDASTWTTLSTITTRPTTGTLLNVLPVYTATSYRYWRLLLSNGNGYQNGLADLEFHGYYASAINGTVDPVSISPPGGFNDLPTLVTLTCNTVGATIKYTTDGTNPQTSGTAQTYTNPFVVSADEIVQACATFSGLTVSRVTQAWFYIGLIVPEGKQWDSGRGYPRQDIAYRVMHDPVGGAWWAYGMNVDSPGVYVQPGSGMVIYSSPDLRNWSYQGNMLLANPGQQDGTHNSTAAGSSTGLAGQSDRGCVVYNTANNNYVYWGKYIGSAESFVCATAPAPQGPWTIQSQNGFFQLSVVTTLTGTTTSGSGVITGLSSTTGLAHLMGCAGTGIGVNTQGVNSISTVDSGSQVTLSVPSTASGTVSLTFYNLYTSAASDCNLFLDPVTGNCYLVSNGLINGVASFLILQLNSAFTGYTPFTTNYYGCPQNGATSIWPNNAHGIEGTTIAYIGGKYVFMASQQSGWLPNLNVVVSAPSPLGPWSPTYSPFQPNGSPVVLTGNTTINQPQVTGLSSTAGLTVGMAAVGYSGGVGYAGNIPAGSVIASIDSSSQVTLSLSAGATVSGVTIHFEPNPPAEWSFLTQTDNLIQIPGRTNGYLYNGDDYRLYSILTGVTSTTLNFTNWVSKWLPITLDGSNNLVINWQSSWNLDAAMPSTGANSPAAPSSLTVT